jgi:hypothetical protein
MLNLSTNTQIYLCTAPTDMRNYAVMEVMRSRTLSALGQVWFESHMSDGVMTTDSA